MAILKRFEIWLLLGLMTAALVFALKSEPPVEFEQEPKKPPVVMTTKKPAPMKLAEVETEIPASEESIAEENIEKEVVSAPPFQIQKVIVTATQQGRIVDLTLLGQAEGSSPVDLNADKNAISVMTESGDEVDRFFLPFPEAAVMDAEEKSIVNLKYWLIDEDTKVLWVKLFNHKLKAEIPE